MKSSIYKVTSIASLKRSSNSVKKGAVLSLGALLLLATVSSISWKSASKAANPGHVKVKPLKVETEVALTAAQSYDVFVTDIFTSAGLQATGMNYQTFKKAVTGYYNLKQDNKVSATKSIITVVDFNKPSTQKRLWIVDLDKKQMLFNTLVAHGRGTGDNMATAFSNTANSNQSSLGFYSTSVTYNGKHGLSLKLNGLDKGFNTNAYNRGVVVHGAEYVSEEFVKLHGRLGRSQGCPALPMALKDVMISTIKGNTTLFIDGPQAAEYKTSLLNEEIASNSYTTFNTGSVQTASL